VPRGSAGGRLALESCWLADTLITQASNGGRHAAQHSPVHRGSDDAQRVHHRAVVALQRAASRQVMRHGAPGSLDKACAIL
jgi:hypothetical protein